MLKSIRYGDTLFNVCLWGKHKHRIVFYYDNYKALCSNSNKCCFVSDPLKADFIVAGFALDFLNDADIITKILEQNSKIKLVVLSEEPFWDNIYTSNIESPTTDSMFCLKEHPHIKYFRIDYTTSDVFEYNFIPYYLTTEPSFLSRYIPLLIKNLKILKEDKSYILKRWSKQRSIFAACENRSNLVGPNILDLSKFRSDLVNEIVESKTIKIDLIGKGWPQAPSSFNRQSLPDWHLDKLVQLSKGYSYCFAIENTYHKYYITEKIYDAYASLAIPLYYANDEHSVKTILNLKGFLNLYNYSTNEEAIGHLQDIDLNLLYDYYLLDVETLIAKMLIPNIIRLECKNRISKIIKFFSTFK
jgi:hypothetical protein